MRELLLIMRMLRHAIRSLRHGPGYTAACVLILALGIGANTAIFSLIDTTLLKPLPYPNVDRLVYLWGRMPSMPEPLTDRLPANRPIFEAWRKAESFDGVAAFVGGTVLESGVERPRALLAEYVSADLLPLLGAKPTLGRLFESREEVKGSDRVVVLSDSYFLSRFDRDPATLGKAVRLGDAEYTVIGVLPPGFEPPAQFEGRNRSRAEVYFPLTRSWPTTDSENNTTLFVVARRKPNVSSEQARAEVKAIVQRLRTEDRDHAGFLQSANVFSFETEDRTPGLDRTLYILLSAVAFLLLIACANLANLTLARAKGRTREVAVRLALGATKTRIAGQLLLESLLVSVAGAAVGLFLATWMIAGVSFLEPEGLDRTDLGELRWPVFAFAACIGVLVALLFGWVPAWSASRTSVNEAMKSGGRTSTSGGSRFRNLLTAGEVAIALMLVTGAGLMIRSVWNLFDVGAGFETDHLVFADIDLPPTYSDDAKRAKFFEQLLERVRTMPGVSSAGVGDTIPLHRIFAQSFTVVGREPVRENEKPITDSSRVSPGFLETIGVPLLAGRRFTDEDVKRNGGIARTGGGKAEGVLLINQAFADAYLRGENPLDHRVNVDDRVYRIVGVIANIRPMGPERPANPQLFRVGQSVPNMILALRSVVPIEALTEVLRKAVWSLDKELPAVELNRMDHYFLRMISTQGLQMLLLGAFAGLGLLLAMVGVFSVLAHSVASRTREFGVRLALGASPAGIGRMVAVQSAWPLGLGVVAGLLGSFALSRFLESQLFNVSARDPLVFTLAIVTVLVVAPFAVWLPVRRAARVECTEALREE